MPRACTRRRAAPSAPSSGSRLERRKVVSPFSPLDVTARAACPPEGVPRTSGARGGRAPPRCRRRSSHEPRRRRERMGGRLDRLLRVHAFVATMRSRTAAGRGVARGAQARVHSPAPESRRRRARSRRRGPGRGRRPHFDVVERGRLRRRATHGAAADDADPHEPVPSSCDAATRSRGATARALGEPRPDDGTAAMSSRRPRACPCGRSMVTPATVRPFSLASSESRPEPRARRRLRPRLVMRRRRAWRG